MTLSRQKIEIDKKEVPSKKLMFCAVLAQTLIDELDDSITGNMFKMKTKQSAKRFLEDLLQVMNQDFQSVEAVDQLGGMSVWLTQLFDVNYQLGKMDTSRQVAFQYDWDKLLAQYGVVEKC